MAFPVCFDISLFLSPPPFCSAVFYTIYAISMRLAFKGGDRDGNAAAPSLCTDPASSLPNPNALLLIGLPFSAKSPRLS